MALEIFYHDQLALYKYVQYFHGQVKERLLQLLSAKKRLDLFV